MGHRDDRDSLAVTPLPRSAIGDRFVLRRHVGHRPCVRTRVGAQRCACGILGTNEARMTAAVAQVREAASGTAKVIGVIADVRNPATLATAGACGRGARRRVRTNRLLRDCRRGEGRGHEARRAQQRVRRQRRRRSLDLPGVRARDDRAPQRRHRADRHAVSSSCIAIVVTTGSTRVNRNQRSTVAD